MLTLPVIQGRTVAQRTRVATYTFGCKVNRADTIQMEQALSGTGECEVVAMEGGPSVIVVNTCTVTNQADHQARQLIRKLGRRHPNARIVVTGCAVESDRAGFEKMPEVDDMIPIREQHSLPGRLGFSVGANAALRLNQRQTRAYLKMQEGCNAYCSFCVLPYVRGRSQSLSLDLLVERAQRLEEAGYREVVLTGTHLGAYGRDHSPKLRLSDALERILSSTKSIRIRVSSVEPTTFKADLINWVASEPRIRPHLHLPLQSGSESVLRRMNRKYFVHNFVDRVKDVVARRPEIAIGTDVIVGFPGESDEEFQATRDVIESLPISYLHVFPFSPRNGTLAYDRYKDDVARPVKKARVTELRNLSARKRHAYHLRFLGRKLPVIVEKKRDRLGRLNGYTPHYIQVRFLGADRLVGQEVEVELDHVEGEFVVGRVI